MESNIFSGASGSSGGGGGGAATIADGADVAEGALADAATSAGGTGSVTAKLRTISGELSPSTIAGYAVTTDDTIAYVTSKVSKASAGTFYGLVGYNSKTSAQFIQIFDSATVPADTTAPKFIIPVPASSIFAFDTGRFGVVMANGISWSNSSTAPTKTIGSADCWVNLSYK